MGPLRILAVVALGLPWLGCQLVDSPSPTYETIEGNPHRDTAAAVKHNDAALRAIEHGHLDRAENLLQRSLIADVSYAPAHNNLGHLYFVQRRYYHAAWEFEYAARLMPDRAEPLNNLGLIYEVVGKVPLAIQQYEQALELAPDNQEFASNLTRARIRQGERGFETAAMLEQVAFRDDRGDWRDWAQEHLHTTHLRMNGACVIPEGSLPPDGAAVPWPHSPSSESPSHEAPLLPPARRENLPTPVPPQNLLPRPTLIPGDPLP